MLFKGDDDKRLTFLSNQSSSVWQATGLFSRLNPLCEGSCSPLKMRGAIKCVLCRRTLLNRLAATQEDSYSETEVANH